eukprot:127620-Pleurochrysis_carterae.AAC.1
MHRLITRVHRQGPTRQVASTTDCIQMKMNALGVESESHNSQQLTNPDYAHAGSSASDRRLEDMLTRQ